MNLPRTYWRRETIACKQGLLSIMGGRKRKAKAREANGRAQRAYINPKRQVAEQPHRSGVPEHYREREEAESEFGRLMLNGRITPAEYEAGRRYALDVGRFRLIYGIPSPDPRAVDLLQSGGGGGEPPPEVVRAVKAAYNAAFEAVGSAGNHVHRIVNAYAVFDRNFSPSDLMLLKRGLDKLIMHYGIDPGKRMERRTIHKVA